MTLITCTWLFHAFNLLDKTSVCVYSEETGAKLQIFQSANADRWQMYSPLCNKILLLQVNRVDLKHVFSVL